MLKKPHSLFVKFGVSVLCSLFLSSFAFAASSVPRSIDYQGIILDAHNNPITTPLSFRFSLWADGDFISADKNSDGSIAIVPSFSGYQEVQNISPDKNGNFRTAIGIITALPKLNMDIHKYLQVEVKALNANNSDYEVLDIDNDINNNTDRKLLTSAPYAISSESLDKTDLGYAPGKIPTLNDQGKIESSAVPNAVDSTELKINGQSLDQNVIIHFGDKGSIIYEKDADHFKIDKGLLIQGNSNITGDALVEGNLSVSGNINGIKISDLNDKSHIQNSDTGTNASTFTLNTEDKQGDVKLQFGNSLGKALKWTAETLRFELGDSLFVWGNLATQGNNYLGDDEKDVTEVSGNLTVKGKINGRDIAADGVKLDNIQDTDDQTASEVSFISENFQATNVYDALVGLKTLISSLATKASELLFTPTASITATNTQDAIVAVDSKVGQVKSDVDSLKNNSQLNLSALKESLLASDNQVRSEFQTADASLKRELLANDSTIQNTLQSSQSSMKDELLQNDVDIQDSLQSQIEALKAEITSTENSIVEKTTFNWSFLTATDSPGKKSGDGDENKSFVALKDGVITGIAVSSNPTDGNTDGTYVITKNDNGAYTSTKQMTSITLNKTGTGDSNNSIYTTNPQAGVAGLTFKAGDVIRAYHQGKDDDNSSNLILELEYNATLATTSVLQSSTRWQDILKARLEEIKKQRGNQKKGFFYYN